MWYNKVRGEILWKNLQLRLTQMISSQGPLVHRKLAEALVSNEQKRVRKAILGNLNIRSSIIQIIIILLFYLSNLRYNLKNLHEV
jgi:hypothetical protein